MEAQTYQNPAQPTKLEEKHVPIVIVGRFTQKGEKEVKIFVGQAPHPMEREHLIEWLRLEKNKEKIGEVRFSALDKKAKAVFSTKLKKRDRLKATSSCNLHGQWHNETEG